MMTRRDYLKLCAAAGVALSIRPNMLWAGESPRRLITRAIPRTGERLPVVGLGSSASFSRMAGEGNLEGVREVLAALVDGGASVFDTAPSYGRAEEVAAKVARENDWSKKLFWATKVNVARGGSADLAAARAQVEQSFEWLGKSPIDLIQVHNLGDLATQLGLLKSLRDTGRIRYLGVTTTFPRQYEELEQVMKREPLDFVGIDYAIDSRVMEERILPIAQDRGIGVLAYQPFGRTRLWQKVEGHTLPDWAGEYDIATWGQFFLKFVVSHPAITVATPATSRARNVVDNLGAATGRLPDPAARQRMIRYIESL